MEVNQFCFQEEEVNIKKKFLSQIIITPFKELYEIFIDEDKAIDYLFNKNILNKIVRCNKCNFTISYYIKKRVYRCNNYQCRKQISIFKDTFFYNLKLPINNILHILYEYLKKTPQNSVSASLNVTESTISYYYNLFRNIVHMDIIENIKNNVIGGINKEVEIDESLFNKRKYNKGHPVNGIWVLGGVEHGTKKVFTIPVEKRDKATLLKNIKKYVKPGTTIYTDCWKGYVDLKENGYNHKTVNHKKYFKDPITYAHTNTIEGTWNGFKIAIKPQYRTKNKLYYHLLECQWRKRLYKKNIWDQFLNIFQDNGKKVRKKYNVINLNDLQVFSYVYIDKSNKVS